MDITLSEIVTIIVVAVVIYILIKYIINPIFKIISGVLLVLLILYILDHFFGTNIMGQIPYGNLLDFDAWTAFIKSSYSQLYNLFTGLPSFVGQKLHLI